MLRKILLCFALVFTSTASFGALRDYTIYYINGMNNAPTEAVAGRNALHQLVLADLPPENVRYFYQNNNAYLTMVDRVKAQLAYDLNLRRDVYKRFWRCDLALSPAVCDSSDPGAVDVGSIINEERARLDENAYVNNPQLQELVAVLRINHTLGRKALLVGHSQGNFYANQAINYLQLKFRDVGYCVDTVATATLASYVAKSGPYITRNDDRAVNRARSWPGGASILPANIDGGGSVLALTTYHNFIEHYLTPSHMRSRLRADIDARTAVRNRRCGW